MSNKSLRHYYDRGEKKEDRWSIGVLEYWSIGVLEYWSIEVSTSIKKALAQKQGQRPQTKFPTFSLIIISTYSKRIST